MRENIDSKKQDTRSYGNVGVVYSCRRLLEAILQLRDCQKLASASFNLGQAVGEHVLMPWRRLDRIRCTGDGRPQQLDRLKPFGFTLRPWRTFPKRHGSLPNVLNCLSA
jgi:hypothetical protein